MSDASKLYLEDLHAGAVFYSGNYEVSATEIMEFARRYDPQPFHTDAEAAKRTFFKGLAASGWHTAAITMRLLVGDGLPIAGGIVGAGGQLTWPAPLRPGSTVHVESTIFEVTPSQTRRGRGTALCRSRTITATGDVVQVAEMKLVVFSREQESASQA